jgi:threonine dehydratase
MVSLADIRAAAEVLRGVIVETPCNRSITLSQISSAEVFLKLENQ